jgi:hypothetical protein
MSMDFGKLNRDGGWRRLNVAVTRARNEMKVFTSFDPGMIDLGRTSQRAIADLKHFIEFADRGPRALAEAVKGSLGGADSPFEEAVAWALQRKGWDVVPQVGVSRFRGDMIPEEWRKTAVFWYPAGWSLYPSTVPNGGRFHHGS